MEPTKLTKRVQALHDFLIAKQDQAFEWSQNDCCLFAADACKAIHGIDVADDFRGKYTDEDSAHELIRTVTNKTDATVADAIDHSLTKHGFTEHENPLMAKRGDIVAIKNGDTLIGGIVHLNGRHVISVSQKGLVRLPISKVVRAWSI